MQDISTKIREIAAKLLAEKKVDAVLGFRLGTIGLISAPTVVRTKKEAAKKIGENELLFGVPKGYFKFFGI